MDQTRAVALDVKAGSGLHGLGNTGLEKALVDALTLIKAPHAGADFGARAECRPTQELAFRRLHAHGLAAVATAFGNGGFKNPGMATQQGALFAGA